METFSGRVSGIDVIATPGLELRCLAIIGEPPDERQVETKQHALQTALELASSKGCEVEVSYEKAGASKSLARVKLLDR